MVNFKVLKLSNSLGAKIRQADKEAASFVIGNKKTTVPINNNFNRVDEAVGQSALAEQNKVLFKIGSKKSITNFSPLCSIEKVSLTSDISHIEPLENINRVCNKFKEDTGLDLYFPDNWNLSGMNNSIDLLKTLIKNGKFPKDIKHIVMSHGKGASLNNTWVFEANEKNVFSWINENIPEGEKCLAAVCEQTSDPRFIIKNKPGLGTKVRNLFSDPKEPGKIVESGKNEIIGYYINTLSDSGVHYY